MNVNEQIVTLANELATQFGTNHIVTLQEIYMLLGEKYGIKKGSIIPSDFCYNRINNGIARNHPMVFAYLGMGKYQCLGENYPYNGPVYHKPRGEKEHVVGKCINGERIILGDPWRKWSMK